MKYYVTFWQKYRHMMHPASKKLNVYLNPDGWVELEAKNSDEAHVIAFRVFGDEFAGIYDSSPGSLFSQGCIHSLEDTEYVGEIEPKNMKCEICEKTPEDAALYRANKPGEMPARWRCLSHMTTEQAVIDPVVKDIMEIVKNEQIMNANKKEK